MAERSTVQREIESQPDIWESIWRRLQEQRETLSNLLFSQCWDETLFAGCGSTYYLAVAAGELYQQLAGQRTRAVPSSEIVLFPGGVYPDIIGQRMLLVALSRSGETTETVEAASEQHRRQMPVLAVTCHSNSTLASRSDAVLAADEAREETVPQTRSFTSMYLGAQYLAGLSADDRTYLHELEQLPGHGRKVLQESAGLIPDLAGMDWERAVFLGSGPFFGLACEAALKLKEMALAWSEAYHFPEFRHGPISLADERTLVVGLLSDSGAAAEQSVLADVRGLGAQTLAIGERVPEGLSTYTLNLGSGLPELARGALYLLPLQLLAYRRALARGLDPARPRHLQQAVVLERI